MRQCSNSESRIFVVCCFALAALSAGCSALTDYGDFKFGPGNGDTEDASVTDSGAAADGGDLDSGPGDTTPDGGANSDGGAGTNDGGGGTGGTDAATTSDGGVEDAGVDAMVSTCPGSVEICDNGIDDDCDNSADCADFDCINTTLCCKKGEIREATCSGGVDNDCDGFVDCADPDCYSAPSCCKPIGFEVGLAACNDGRDNDCDGVSDCDDHGCDGVKTCCVATGGPENTLAACGDGIDNDCDGLRDCRDPKCAKNGNCGCTPDPAPQGTAESTTGCADNRDNDCDGKTDCADDGCAASSACTVSCFGTSNSESSCNDTIDNDCDKNKDCKDDDCFNTVRCCTNPHSEQENSATLCADERDNDCDGLIDCSDPGCGSQIKCCIATGAESSPAACNDGKDNDCDMKVDCADESCAGTTACCSSSGAEDNVLACTDGVDNDCDGQFDCNDPDCSGVATCCGLSTESVGTVATNVCCTADGASDVARPNDGTDNECDGLTDVALLQDAFPRQGIAASADAVWLTITPEIDANATLECSTHRPDKTQPFGPCPRQKADASKISPLRGLDPTKSQNNGLWTTEVRWKFPNGRRSQVFEYRYYVHHSLNGVAMCEQKYRDDEYFSLASGVLTTSPNPGNFAPNIDTFLANPFVRVKYKVPISGAAFVSYWGLDGQQPSVDMWSLRKRFTLDSNNRLLLVTRSYRSTRADTCTVGSFKVHNHKAGGGNTAFVNYKCQAIVMNRAGAGVCLINGSSGLEILAPSNNKPASMLGWTTANKFMWRNFVRNHYGSQVNFTPKCATPNCPQTYLPDRARFGP